MKQLLEKLRPHQQTILTEMKKVGYDRVYLAEPMTCRPLTELTLLVEVDNEDSWPTPGDEGRLRTLIEQLIPGSLCVILDKASLEEKITKGDSLSKKLSENTLNSAQLLKDEMPELVTQSEKLLNPQKKRKDYPDSTEKKNESNQNQTDDIRMFKIKKENEKPELIQAIIRQLYANPEVIQILRENPGILRIVDENLDIQKDPSYTASSVNTVN